eukprot:scaffold98226_cov31-Phaeocystis_antarctica.AAC.1
MPLAVLPRLIASTGCIGSHSSCASIPISSWPSCSSMHEDTEAVLAGEEVDLGSGRGGAAAQRGRLSRRPRAA